MAKLLLKLDDAVIREFTLKGETAKIGRKSENEIVINNPAVSGCHAVIEEKDGIYTIEDLDSTNGTSVNDERIKKRELKNNDVIGIAKHRLVFLADDSAAAVAAHTSAKIKEKKEEASDAHLEMTPVADATSGPHKADDGASVGVLTVLKGGEVGKKFDIKGTSVYIGKSDRAQVPIQGGGLFGGAPDMAASVRRKPEGFFLTAVEDGYPVVSGNKVSGSVRLNNGDIIELGSTTLQFSIK
ncbi:MAG: FHA domain-containing protein [Elusimicrobiota bacterium]